MHAIANVSYMLPLYHLHGRYDSQSISAAMLTLVLVLYDRLHGQKRTLGQAECLRT